MAMLNARSMLLSNLQEGTTGIIANNASCIKLRFHHRTRGFQCPSSVVVLKLKDLSCIRKQTTQLHLLRSYRHSCSLGSRSLQCYKGKGDSSPTSLGTSPTKIPREIVGKYDRNCGCGDSQNHNSRVVDYNCSSGLQIKTMLVTVIGFSGNKRSKGNKVWSAQVQLPPVLGILGKEATLNLIHRIFEFAVDRMLVVLKDWSYMKVAGILVCILMLVPSANAVDALKTCTCLLKECRIELAKCLSNPSCAANIACLQTCNNRPDETECQIKCGDLFENKVVDEFNECAVSRKKCVPTKSDVGDFPVPNPDVIVKSFNIADFRGKWFITSGLNPTFDAFDCQLHDFHIESNKLIGNLSWRIKTPDAGFLTRTAVQRFVQDPSNPGILYNHDNEYLHYQDDWYILSSKIENKPDDYIFVYYRGRNDAWDGYGGAFVYTGSAVLPESIIPELEKATKNVGRDFSQFIKTDNTCGPEPSIVERLEKKVEEGEETIVREVEELEGEVEKTELNLFQKLAEGFKILKDDEENFLRGLSKEEMEILNGLKMEAAEVEKLFGGSLPIRRLR